MSSRNKGEPRATARRAASSGPASFRIGQLAKLSGFAPVVLRAWEQRHDLLDPVRTDNGYRLYTKRDLAVLARVRELLDEGHRISDIARMGRDALAPEASSGRSAGAPGSVGSSPRAASAGDFFEGRTEIAWSVLDALPGAVFVTDTRGLVRWVSRGVPVLCGYDIADFHGRSPGGLLQGPGTDQKAVVRMRTAIADQRPCSMPILNYHRSGEPYMALLDIAPLGFGANHFGFVGLARRIESDKRHRPRNRTVSG
jgi:DNA-binding transcriptional MerR regulator